MCERLIAVHAKGSLQCFGANTALKDGDAFRKFLKPLRRMDWFVYAKRPFAGPDSVLSYLARYTPSPIPASSPSMATASASNGKITGATAKPATAS